MDKLQTIIKKYLEERNWNNLRPSDVSKSISIEASELLEIFQWSNPSLDETKKDTEKIERIKSELADVFIYCLDMATLLELNAEEIIKDKLAKIELKYPPAEVKDTKGKEPGTDDAYLSIKSNYRKSA